MSIFWGSPEAKEGQYGLTQHYMHTLVLCP